MLWLLQDFAPNDDSHYRFLDSFYKVRLFSSKRAYLLLTHERVEGPYIHLKAVDPALWRVIGEGYVALNPNEATDDDKRTFS